MRRVLALLGRPTAEWLCLFENYEETAAGRFQMEAQVNGGAGRQSKELRAGINDRVYTLRSELASPFGLRAIALICQSKAKAARVF